jgi:hypothetical protein
MKKIFALTLVLLFTASLLWGCGAASLNGSKGDALYDKEMGPVSDSITQESGVSKPSQSTGTSQLPLNQKLVRKIRLDAETEDLDTLISQVDQRISELSGYVEQREVYNGSVYASRRYRYANLTIRVPVDKLDSFVDHVSEVSNITSANETTENITLSYIATQSRITALETEQTRLLELLAKAENMSDLLQIEARLTQVRTELEEVTSQLRLYNNLVDYGTIYLKLTEVKEYTVTEEPSSVWERMGSGFLESLKNLGNFFTELFVFIVVALPYLIPLGAVVVAAILFIGHKRKKRSSKKQTEAEE